MKSSGWTTVGRRMPWIGRRRPEAHGGVDVVDAEAGGAAVGVGDAGLHADAVADLERLDLGAGLDHDARGLVAEDHRLADDEGADGAVGVVVHVRAADADGVQLDAHVARAEGLLALDGEVAERELVLLFEHQGLHGSPLLNPCG